MTAPKRVLIIYTGGTIGMERSPRGYVPAPGRLQQQLERMPQFHDPAFPRFTTPETEFGRRIQYHIKEFAPLLDSSNMDMSDWVRLAVDIHAHYAEYDAFVVLHGTDTMAYTASALSFALPGLTKPVIVTGSQIPLREMRNDARNNLLTALLLAAKDPIPEVCLYFNGRLMRGNRTQKVDTAGFEAFASLNLPPLAEVGIRFDLAWQRIRPSPRAPLKLRPITERNVAIIRLFPGISAETLGNFLRPPLRGAVLQTYGTGNMPDNRPDLLAVLREATERGVVLVNTTQCLRGAVTTDYAGGNLLDAIGVVGGADMTPEAALTKLAYLLSRDDLRPDEVRRHLRRDLRGELTDPNSRSRFSFRDAQFVQRVAESLAAHAGEDHADEVSNALYPVLLCSAAAMGDAETLERMIADGVDVNRPDYDGHTALQIAAREGNVEIVRLLLREGADRHRDGDAALALAEQCGHFAVADLLRKPG
ncbi:MAG: asparaginase [Myxococcales bacterium]|nr:asparaginase [Myxococcales bacterium]